MPGAGSFAFEETLELCRGLWAASGDLRGHIKTRDDLVDLVSSHWTGPHHAAFMNDITHDRILEDSSVRDLRNAATQWAQAWVNAMNAENKYREDEAYNDINSGAPGENLDQEYPEYTPIVRPPIAPHFDPTGGLYDKYEGNWATEVEGPLVWYQLVVEDQVCLVCC